MFVNITKTFAFFSKTIEIVLWLNQFCFSENRIRSSQLPVIFIDSFRRYGPDLSHQSNGVLFAQLNLWNVCMEQIESSRGQSAEAEVCIEHVGIQPNTIETDEKYIRKMCRHRSISEEIV